MRRASGGSPHTQLKGSLRLQLLSRSLLVVAVLLVFIGLFQYVLMRKFTYENKASALRSQILSLPPDIWRDRQGHGVAGADRSIKSGFGLGVGKPQDNAANGSSSWTSGEAGQSDDSGEMRGRYYVPDATVVLIGTDLSFTTLSEWTDQAEPPRLADETYQAVMNSGEGESKGAEYRIAKDAEGREQLVVLRSLGKDGQGSGVIQISTGTEELKKTLNGQLLMFGGLALLALFAGLLTLLPVLRRTLTPLSELVDKVERIDAGNLDERFPAIVKPVEIGRLSASFNGMLARLDEAFETEKEAKEHMRQFVADASHELRTPLTSIHGFLEVLLRGASSNPEQLERALRSMHGESERLRKLVGDLLMLAKLDQRSGVHAVRGNLSDTLREMEPQLRMLAGVREVGFSLPEGMYCLYDPDKIKQVVLNLFHNAVQHTDGEGGAISLTIHRADGFVNLDVDDNGSGIDPAHLPHVFDRFYRSDSSRTRKYGGAGLGLSISKSIVDALGGGIAVASDPGRGTTFTIRLVEA
ncbi:sensor histidine kinase [Cohnella sp. GCM10020058]|uniref:sensor histidine kinase n=1 Tax=Cohnella sp. GCM10020058 TaxID=3317330 RepID=UPI0036263D02